MLGFGGDSVIELPSAAVVFCVLRVHFDEARAARMAGALLFALAGLVVLTSVLNFIGCREARRSLIGICILMTAAIAMPWLANQKRKLAVVTSSAALRADAAESALCGYMAWDCSCRPCGERCMGQIVGRPCGLSGPDSAHSA